MENKDEVLSVLLNERMGVWHDRNNAALTRRLMEAHGWINPDKVGHIYLHPSITHPSDGRMIEMTGRTACEVELAWELDAEEGARLKSEAETYQDGSVSPVAGDG